MQGAVYRRGHNIWITKYCKLDCLKSFFDFFTALNKIMLNGDLKNKI